MGLLMSATKILIAEDTPTWVIIIKKYLKSKCKIDIADTGIDALIKFKNAREAGTPYNLIFLDMLMPVMNGDEVLKAIRKYEKDNNCKQCKVIMVSAVDKSAQVLEAFKNEANGYIFKHSTMNKFSAELNKYLDQAVLA
jgi:two-component system chemotaxis response regulator CheY